MKEFIEKLIERLEELQQCQIEKYTKSLDEGNLACIYDKTDIEDAKVSAVWKVLDIVNQLAEEYKEGFCEWKQYDENDIYYTGCEQIHMFIDGSPTDNKYEFCPYCGKKIKVAPYTEGE